MQNRIGIGKQLFIALSIVNLSVTFFAMVLGYVIYNYAVDVGWISLSSLQEDWNEFHFVDWIWLVTVMLCGSGISLLIVMLMAKRFITPLNFLAEALKKITQGELSARADIQHVHSKEISDLIYNFNQMAEQLERSVQNAQVWNAAIAHELRTPITILQGRLQGIADGVFEPKPELMLSLLNQTEGLSHLVEDLRTLSLVENQQLRLQKEQVEFQFTLDKVLNFFEDRLKKAHLKPQLSLTAPVVFCDRRRLEQVLIALLDNMVRYSNSGNLYISTSQTEDEWKLSIADEGPGISPEAQQALFTPFFRQEQSRNKEFGGTGLGLAVVQAILNAHDGRVEYRNEQANSVFILTLSTKAR